MSLIIDALKKAQQLRSKESSGSPFFKYQSPRKSRKKRWWIIGATSVTLLILPIVLWRFFPSPITSPPVQTVAIPETKNSLPVDEKISSELSKEEVKETGKPEPKDKSKVSMPATPDLSPREIDPLLQKKREGEILPKPVPEEKMIKAEKKQEKAVVDEKPSLPAPPQKEETVSKPFVSEQGAVRERHLSIEVARQFNLGVSFYNQREIAQAIHAYQKVIEMDPNHIEAYNNLGVIYQEIGDSESALKIYQKTIEINPQYEKGLNNIGILLYLKGENEKAMEVFKKILFINPNHIESHIHIGTLYKKGGEVDKGIESYRKALAIDPLHGETHYHLGLLYEQMGNREPAIQHYQQFVQLSSNAYPDLASKVRRHINQLIKMRGVKKD